MPSGLRNISSVMPDQPIQIVTLANENYVIPLAVLGRSIAENLDPSATAVLHVIDGGITADSKAKLEASWDQQHLRLHFLPPHFAHERELPVWGRMPPLTYARVFVPFLLPDTCHKAIFLDSDIVLAADVSRLWSLDTTGKSLLAAQDPAIPSVSSPGGLERYRQLAIPADHPYFNAGAMVVNLERWRQSDVTDRVMAFTREYAAELNYCDQDGLNAILWNDWSPLDPRWQVQPRLAARQGISLVHRTSETWLYHCSGRLKPWLYRGSTPVDQLFYGTLDRTAWRGWRPPLTTQSILYRLYDSPLRDWLYPVEQWAHVQLRNRSRRSAKV